MVKEKYENSRIHQNLFKGQRLWVVGDRMSFILDPPALILLGALVYVVSKRYYLRRVWQYLFGIVIVGAFLVVSILLYLDVIRWHIPFIIDMKGSEWMFHSNITGIYKEDVCIGFVIFMFVLYPLWYYLGYIAAQYLSKRLQIDKTVYNSSHVKSLKKSRINAFSIKRGTEPRKILRECIAELGGIETFVQKGDTVVIKANISGGNPQRPGSYTSVEVTDELSRMIWEIGVTPVVVDADMIWTEFWQVASAQGYISWADHATATLKNLSETKLAYFDFGGVLEKSLIAKILLNADVIVSLATMKTHLLTGVSLGMKNMYGTFPQMDKAIFHKMGIEQVIFQVNKAFPPNLTIIDGTIGGDGMGPLSCDPVNFNTIVASGNVVTADAVACTLMGVDPLTIEHIRLGHENNLGNADVDVDFERLPPHERDRHWLQADVGVGKFYSALIQASLKYPGIEQFFNLIADFVFYDLAVLPLFEHVTPEELTILEDIVRLLQLSGRVKG